MLGSLLGCYGSLFTTCLDTAWVPENPNAAEANSSSSQPQQESLRYVVSIANNEITRVKCDLESVLFQSCLAPRIAVRLLHAVAVAVAQKVWKMSGKQLVWLDKVFDHLQEYLSKDSLDALVCLHAKAAVEDGVLRFMLSGDVPDNGGVSSNTVISQAAAAALAGGGLGAIGAGSSGVAAAAGVWPVYIINDVNMLTVLETVKLMMDY